MNPRTESPWLSGIAQRWYRRRTFGASSALPRAELVARKHAPVSVVLPALNEAETIGEICAAIRRDLLGGLVDELIVIDCSSDDATRAVAAANGAAVYDVAEVLPDTPVVPGKGEALWRSLSIVSGDLVVWLDSDIRNFSSAFVERLLSPLLIDPTIAYVKGAYRRPLARGGELIPDEGGRVTELLARPLLAAFFPELGGFVQPLAGEYAGRVEVLRRVPFFTGYSVEAGLLIDLLDDAGLDALAQADLGERIHRNRPLADLAPTAYAIGRSILRRAEQRGRLTAAPDLMAAPFLRPTPDGMETHDVRERERPPMEAFLAAELGGEAAS